MNQSQKNDRHDLASDSIIKAFALGDCDYVKNAKDGEISSGDICVVFPMQGFYRVLQDHAFGSSSICIVVKVDEKTYRQKKRETFISKQSLTKVLRSDIYEHFLHVYHNDAADLIA